MLTVAPRAAAMRLIAATSVVQSEHEELYPFCQMAPDPALSTQIRTGLLRLMFDLLALRLIASSAFVALLQILHCC
jgi:hypothetical protein